MSNEPSTSVAIYKCQVKDLVDTIEAKVDKIQVDVKDTSLKSFECDICKKTFLLEWRMKKHVRIHARKPTQCYYWFFKLCMVVGCCNSSN